MERERPYTPVRSSSGGAMLVQDSPYSDYYTDEARSVEQKQAQMPSSETQRLLLRLNNIGSQILRQDASNQDLSDLSYRLDALEATVSAPIAQSRQPSHMIDSGLFMEDDIPTPNGLGLSTDVLPKASAQLRSALDDAADADTPRKEHAVSKREETLLKDTQQVLDRVTQSNHDLRQRFEEMRSANDKYAMQIEESNQEVLSLRSQTEALRADLGFDHSELLFLKLQLKALELQADSLADDQANGREHTTKRVLLQDDMERWKADWDEVDARLRGRRGQHSIGSASQSMRLFGGIDSDKIDEEGEWKLDLCKRRQGRVQSITIRRLESLGFDAAANGQAGEQDDEDQRIDSSVIKGSDGKALFASALSDVPALQSSYRNTSTQTDESEDLEGDAQETDAFQPARTPWQELCDSLTAWAGMDKE